MPICPHCGATSPGEPKSNEEDEILLRIPERDFALMRVVFRAMNAKLGMMGLGELASRLRPYGQTFSLHPEFMRYFDDEAVAMCSIGISRGFRAGVRLTPARRDFAVEPKDRFLVDVDFAFEGGKSKSIRVSDCAPDKAALWFRDWFEDLQERIRPLQGLSPS